ncbi:MAG: alpha-amylase family glycosyl hydrolase [Aggregatilineales bacterium]
MGKRSLTRLFPIPIGLILAATALILTAACDSSPAVATVTARAVGTNVIALTLSVVPSNTPAPTSTITPTPLPTTPPTPVPTGLSTAASTESALATQASTQALQAATAILPQAPTALATVPATSAPTQAATQAVQSAAHDTSWFSNAIMYSVFVRSFRDSNGDGIGDLQGVIDGLDYIQSLGVNTIWLLPVFKSPSYHGYDVSDYNTVNSDYGTNDDLLRLIREVHKRHMHILLDYVVNHTSNQHPYFKDAYGNPNSQYAEFYHWLNPEHTQYQSFADVKEMPTLNYDSPKVRQFAIDIALHWMDPLGNGDLSAGVDGYRCDDAVGPPHDFWAQLRTAMTAKNPNSLLLGEIWKSNLKDIAAYLQGDQFDAAFDFPWYTALAGNQDRDGGGALAGQTPGFAAAFLRAGQKLYPPNAHIVRFVNNHDTNRVMSDVNGDMARARAAAVLELTVPGVPIIYYGEELGMKGDKGGAPWYDAYRREPLPWYATLQGKGETSWFNPAGGLLYEQPNSGVSVEEEAGKSDSLLTLYRTLGKLRMAHDALRTGQFDLPTLSGDASNLYDLRVWNARELIVVVINFSTKPITWTPDTIWTADGTTYSPASAPVLAQTASQTADKSGWVLQAAGYLVFQASTGF